MSDYIVKWRHLRWPKNVDDLLRNWYRGRLTTKEFMAVLDAYGEPVPMFVLRDAELYPAQHGGMTECGIYCAGRAYDSSEDIDVTTEPHIVASAISICSWRDQFDRRTGRLYSLAYALCKLTDVAACIRCSIMIGHFPDHLTTQTVPLYDAFEANDLGAVKRICAEIVAAWRKPKAGADRETVHYLYRWAMRMCDDYNPETWACFLHYSNQLGATHAQLEAARGLACCNSKREVASICDQIVKEWHNAHH